MSPDVRDRSRGGSRVVRDAWSIVHTPTSALIIVLSCAAAFAALLGAMPVALMLVLVAVAVLLMARERDRVRSRLYADRLVVVRGQIAPIQNSIGELSAKLQQLTGEQRLLNDALDGASDRIGVLADEVRSASDQLATVDRALAGLDRSFEERHVALQKETSRLGQLANTHRRDLDGLSSRVGRERSERLVAEAKLAADGHSAKRLVVVIAPQRTGSTVLMDRLRTRADVDLWPTTRYWQLMGLVKNRRYPVDLSNRTVSGHAIEVSVGVGSTIPVPGDSTIRPPQVAVEKVHPEFFGFSSDATVAALEALSADLPVAVIYLVRAPLQAMWSMAEYKSRNPNWYGDLDVADVPEFVCRSMLGMESTMSQVDGHLVDYAGVLAMTPKTADVMAAAVGPERAVAPGAELAEVEWAWGGPIEARSTPFRPAEGNPSRSRSGPKGVWASAGEFLDVAEAVYGRMLAAVKPG